MQSLGVRVEGSFNGRVEKGRCNVSRSVFVFVFLLMFFVFTVRWVRFVEIEMRCVFTAHAGHSPCQHAIVAKRQQLQ